MATVLSPSPSPSADPASTVHIVGGGPSGLLLARYLQLHAVPCIVYEREPSRASRGQGGTLDLHADTGLRALKAVGLLERAQDRMRAEGEALKIMDGQGRVWYDENGREGSGAVFEARPEIDRADLRDLLVGSLAPGTVQWGTGLSSISAPTPDAYVLALTSGAAVSAPVIVGADGCWSRVRPLLHAARPAYSGLTMIDMLIPATSMTPALAALVGAGGAMILGEGKGVIPQMNSAGRCRVYAALTVDEGWAEAHPLPDTGRRQWLAGLYPGWQHAAALFSAVDERSVTPRKIYQCDPDLSWTSDLSGVTIIGDAAHVQSPFAGEGVNQALADALELGRVLVAVLCPVVRRASLPPFPLSLLPVAPRPTARTPAAPDRAALHAALRAFERRMMARARAQMRASKRNLDVCFGDDAARRMVWLMRRMMAGYIARAVVRAPVTFARSFFADDE